MAVGVKFNPLTDIPDLARKVIFITGGTAGLGKLSVIHLARRNPAHIYFSGRNASRAEQVIAEAKKSSPDTNVSFIKMDLASLKSVQSGAKEFLTKSNRLDILMNNAGIACVPPGLTQDGYEVHMGTNHVGHSLLTKLLLPTLLETAKETGDVRVISNASEAHRFAMNTIHYDGAKKPDGAGFMFMSGWRRYGETKFANMLYAAELARRYPSITSVTVHPGVIGTDMVDSLTTTDRTILNVVTFGENLPPETGVLNQLWAASAEKKSLVNGAYYTPVAKKGTNMESSGLQSKAKQLWDWTEKELEAYN